MKRRISENGTVRTVFWRFGGGLLIALIAAVGVGQSIRASTAYAIMHEASFGETRRDPDKALVLCHQAYRIYPHSYHLAIYAGSLAWHRYIRAHERGQEDNAAAYLDKVRQWVRIGLHRNPYPIQLRWLNKRLLEIDNSIEAAIAFWEAHTDWHFWYAFNHAVLADLYTRAGRFDDAERALRMLRRSEYYAEAAAALEDARNP